MSFSWSLFLLGMLSGLSFAPVFFLPALLTLAFLCYKIQTAINLKQAFTWGFIYGFGHFLISMYWISIGVSVYIEEFWWALLFALFGLPIILACFISASCALSWKSRNNYYYQLIFCVSWVFFEWLRSWLFTGLPWNLLGYALSLSDVLIQVSSIIGIYGLSFIVIYTFTTFHYAFTKQYEQLKASLLTSIIIIFTIIFYGKFILNKYPTNFSNIMVRLVQPSIPQSAKWDIAEFWKNLNTHIQLSQLPGKQDLIIWSEAALVVPHTYRPVKIKLLEMLNITNSILITGGVTENDKQGEDFKIYTTLYALNSKGDILFDYNKSHLVPFGEYMPLKFILPIKKLTPGFQDYTEGTGKLVHLEKLNIYIKALICYESIFPDFVRTSNKTADLIINVTNDAWYGNSSGPYQHFHISRMRAIENGIPMLRVANNGISAIIDPLGRVIKKLDLNEIGIVDGTVPTKLDFQTFYSRMGDYSSLIAIFLVLIIQSMVNYILKNYRFIYKKT